MIHELKCWPIYFHEVFMSHKTFEVRENDRDFKVGDVLTLREYDPITKKYSGRTLSRNVTYILKCGDFMGIANNYVVMSIQ